jgi:hypothetical protein
VCFWGFLITTFLQFITRFLYWVVACSQKCEGILSFFIFIFCLQSNLAKLYYGWSPVHVHHKYEKKDPDNNGLIRLLSTTYNSTTSVHTLNTVHMPTTKHPIRTKVWPTTKPPVFRHCVPKCSTSNMQIYEHICVHLLLGGIVTSYHLRVVKVGKESWGPKHARWGFSLLGGWRQWGGQKSIEVGTNGGLLFGEGAWNV